MVDGKTGWVIAQQFQDVFLLPQKPSCFAPGGRKGCWAPLVLKIETLPNSNN